MTAVLYAKLGGIALAIALLFGAGYHFGGMASKTQLEAQDAAQSQATAKAVLAERASALAQAAQDHTAENTHAADLAKIDSTPPSIAPVLVYVSTPGAIRTGAVPGPQTQAGGQPADTQGGGRQPVGGGRDIRPDIEALKKRLETVMADYRQLDAEWPR